MGNESNKILLTGSVAKELTYSHRIFGENFYNFKISIMRKSGVFDELPVTISERLLQKQPEIGEICSLSGQIRTYNECVGDKNHLKIVVFCREIIGLQGNDKNPWEKDIEQAGENCEYMIDGAAELKSNKPSENEKNSSRRRGDADEFMGLKTQFNNIDTDRNEAFLEGYLCRKPYYRVSPLGREICDIMLAVNRIHGKSDYIPCIAWGRNAKFVSTLKVGSKIDVRGRLQSRSYKKIMSDGSCELKVAYELSIRSMECETV